MRRPDPHMRRAATPVQARAKGARPTLTLWRNPAMPRRGVGRAPAKPPEASTPAPVDVPTRPLFSDAIDEPGVYRSASMLRGRWIYYALGRDGAFVDCRHPQPGELDEDVVAVLERSLAAYEAGGERSVRPTRALVLCR